MAGVTKVNPVTVYGDFEQVGKDITFFTVSVDASGSTGPEGALQALYSGIQSISTIIAAGVPGANMAFGVEGEIGQAELEAAVQAIGTVDAVDFSAATVTVGTLAVA